MTRHLRLAFPEAGEEELAEIAAVLETGHLTMGPKVEELETLLARAVGTQHAAAVSSGTAALHVAVLALGASHRGRACGSLGVLACFSFHPRKIVTTGEGGAVTTDDAELDERVRSLRHHGWSPSSAYDDMPAGAFNYRLSDVLCALGIPQLRRFDELYAAYDRVARGYSERLAHLPVTLPATDPGDRHGWQAYVLQVDRRDEVMASLRAAGVQCQIGTYALHRLGAYGGSGPFPGADAAFERALALPLHGRLSDSDLDRVAEALDKIVSHH